MNIFASTTADCLGFFGDIKFMAHENWQLVKEIFADALRQTPEKRSEFLDSACHDDKNLRREVESLLASFDSAENFMESPAIGEVAEKFAPESRQFSENQILGHYEIIGKIGAGGMGNVYLAQDLELQRRVALKILRENLSQNEKAKQRLLHEARAVAKLDHPNICAIYEISETDNCSFIVMQYVSGETLADILTKERLSVEKSCDLAMQIAAALEEAHAQNIIHRDIKPANIIVNKKGQLKVLDFGLAKIIEAETGNKATKNISSSGAIIGTVPYMSPEQLRGKKLDASTDIFSFGVLFYEILSGISPFQHDSNAESISAILNDEPDLSKIPNALCPILKKCLLKDKTKRYQKVQNLVSDLRNVGTISAEIIEDKIYPKETAEQTSTPRYYFWKSLESYFTAVEPKTSEITKGEISEIKRSIDKSFKFWFSAFTIFILLGAIYFIFGVKIDFFQFKNIDDFDLLDSIRPVRLVSWKTSANSYFSNYSSSHDGKMIAYSSVQDGKNESIYVKQTSGGEDIRVTKDDWNNQNPVWSPDDQRIAFSSFREGQSGIYICPSLGGAATLLKTVGDGVLFPRYWSKDDTKIFYEYDGNLFQLDINTKESFQITNFEPSRRDIRYFDISPDETATAYSDNGNGQTDIWLMKLKGGTPQRLTDDREKEFNLRWHPDNERILYTVFRDNHSQINLTDRTGRKPRQITRGDSEYEIVGISTDGTKIFYLTWEDKSDVWGVNIDTGEEFEFTATPEYEFWSEVSPDGNSVVFQTHSAPHPKETVQNSLIAVKSAINKSVQLTLKGYNPHWLPDSRHIAFLRWNDAEKTYNLWLVNTFNGEEKQIPDSSVISPATSILPYNRAQTGEFSWSPDSTKFVYLDGRRKDIRQTSIESEETTKLTSNENLTYYCPLWSPDGKRIAYASQQKSSEKGQSSNWKIHLFEQEKTIEIFSTNESLRLLGWSASGSELFFETTSGAMKSSPLDVNLWRVSIKGEALIIGTFNNIYAKSMSLSADGKMVAYTSRQNDKDNIFIAATNDGNEKKITVNGNTHLFFGSLAWSPDGKTVFFDKQEEINTFSMFENFK